MDIAFDVVENGLYPGIVFCVIEHMSVKGVGTKLVCDSHALCS
jgi:hypothetical protein